MNGLINWFQGLFMQQMLTSKKFWYTLIGVLTTLLSENLGLDAEQVNNILMSIGALVLGRGFADMKKK